MKNPTSYYIDQIIHNALKEDDCHNDITSKLLISARQTSQAKIIAKEEVVICGSNIVKAVFKSFDKNIQITSQCRDGQKIKKGSVVITIKGSTQKLLSAERVALNFLGHLSGIATLTRRYVDAVKPFKVKILDTRKTTPGLRILERIAVCAGGGENHRFNLNDMILIKDNHREAFNFDKFCDKLIQIRKSTKKTIEIEVDNLDQLKKIIPCQPDIILLDNMNPQQIEKALRMIKSAKNKKILTEASGGITLKNIRQYAKTGVDRISIGALTHSAPNINFSMGS